MPDASRASRYRSKALLGLHVLTLAATLVAAGGMPAKAQFGFFGEGNSAQAAYDTIASNGFRLAGPMMQNGDVYVADVFDRRQRRQRLILSRRDGHIVQRFMVDVGRRGSFANVPPDNGPRRPLARNDDGDFMSRIMRGFGDDGPPRPPADVDTGSVTPRELQRNQRAVKPRPSDVEPQLATRREEPPIAARPLAAPASPVQVQPAVPAAPPPATTASVPSSAPVNPSSAVPDKPVAVPSPAAGPVRATVVNTDPLRIPGERPASPAPAVAAAAAKPVPPPLPKPAAKDVPVAPLE